MYLRHWKPDEHELGELVEILVEGTGYDALVNQVSFFFGRNTV